MTCSDTTLALGAYVLGALDDDERREVDAHVQQCPACAAELAGLQPLPPLLHRVRLEDVEVAAVPPSPDLFERVAAAAAAESRATHPAPPTRAVRRPRRRLLAVAAAVVVLGAGGGAVAWVTSSSSEAAHSAVAGSVHMTVTADADPAGTTLDVTVAGVAARENCRLVVVDDDGGRHQAGAWTASYEGRATFQGWTDVSRSHLSDVVLLGTDGQELVRVRL